MSIAASILQLEAEDEQTNSQQLDADKPVPELEAEREAFDKLIELSPPSSSGPVIAVDLDDVLSQTNDAVAKWHNLNYGTEMNLSHFYYYYYWKNPFWGTPQETFDKVKKFYATDTIYNTIPVPGSREGVQTLKNLGYRLIVVTARSEDNADNSWKWLEQHFPGMFDSIICTGQFKDAGKVGHEVTTKLTKAQVCEDLAAKLLIDDSAENALQVSTAERPTPVILFGDYQWNKRISSGDEALDEMTFARRLKASGGHEFWKDEKLSVPSDAPLHRIKDWSGVIQWVKSARLEGRM